MTYSTPRGNVIALSRDPVNIHPAVMRHQRRQNAATHNVRVLTVKPRRQPVSKPQHALVMLMLFGFCGVALWMVCEALNGLAAGAY